MDAKNDLILGVFANYSFEWLEAYMVSSKRCGFRGRKILLVWNVAEPVRKKLVDYGFELVDVPPANMSVEFCSNFFEYRDKLAYEFLRDRGHEFRYVFWMDIRDLVFQADPSKWMEKNLGDKEIVAGSECIRIKDESCNDNWLRDIYDTETYNRIRECEVLNGGTFAGTVPAMTEVFRRIYDVAKNTKVIAEQAALNVILRDSDFVDRTLVPRMSDGFAVVGYGFGNQLQHVWTDQIPDIRRGVLYPSGRLEPFCIVHQYDRNRDWKPAVSALYKTGLTPSPRRYAADGLTRNWWDGR
jgi:hypothetical protein